MSVDRLADVHQLVQRHDDVFGQFGDAWSDDDLWTFSAHDSRLVRLEDHNALSAVWTDRAMQSGPSH
jgi:hypothetical protein